MVKLPEPPPPGEIAKLLPAVVRLPSGAVLWRVYFRGGSHPTRWYQFRAFGPLVSARFDHHDPPARVQERPVLYCARDAVTCLAEVFQETRVIDGRVHVPWLVAFELRTPVSLLDLTGQWPTRAGASQALASGRRDRARRWAAVVHEAYPQLQGMTYRSSMHGGGVCAVLHERAVGAVAPPPLLHRSLDDPAIATAVANAARDLGYDLL